MGLQRADATDGRVLLGIDPGSRKTGYAVIRQQGRSLSVVESGTFTLDARHSVASRLGALQEALEALVGRHALDSAAIEDIFSHKNVRSALALGQARGVVLGVCGRRGIPVESYAPATVKQSLTGHGRADKLQIQRMVSVLLGLSRAPARDEADALAVALCHALQRRATRRKENER